MPGGRPRAFQSVEELQTAIDAYFDDEIEKGDPITVSGLACALEVDRRTLVNYNKDNHEFFPTIKRAIALIEAQKVKDAMSGKYDKTICIFDLKNNHGWRDERHIEEKSRQIVELKVSKKMMHDAIDTVREILKS